ncbi:MAG TPA: response regulator transcription factor [Acidimicrobiia bacterium]|nr:response regulator transcription factor [Acidimicrobiia bacterium]
MTVEARVLLAEDDRGVRESLERALRYEGFEVVTAADGRRALELARTEVPDLLVLDVMMPEVDGLEVARRLRARKDRVPILMLTARTEVSDRVAGLEAGADDYLIKPFALDELLARMRALLRRSGVTGHQGPLEVADLVLDPATRRVTRGGRELELTKTEFDLLELFLHNAGIVLTRDIIYERVWGFDFTTSSNSIDVYVGYLRRKAEAGDEPRLIHTVRGVGYVLREP